MFRKKSEPVAPNPEPARPTAPVDYPTGIAVEVESGDVYFVKGLTKFKFFSHRCFESWSLVPARGSRASLSKFKSAPGPLGFRDGTLVKTISDGKYYLISGNKRRLVVTPDVHKYGLSLDRAILVSDEEARIHEAGEVLE